jgi:zinc protease
MEVIKETLANGVTILVKPTKGLGIVSVATFIRGGILDETINGITRLTIYMLLKGSKNFSKEQISATFEDYGGGIGVSTHIEYSLIEFSTKIEGLKKGLNVVKDMLENPLFPKEDLERERRNTITAIKSKKENPFQYAYSELKKVTYKGTPYANDVLGEEETVANIQREDLTKRWEQLKEGGRFVVSLVGDIKDIKETLNWLKETFEWLPKSEFKYPTYDKKVDKNELKNLQRGGSQATILCAFNAPHYKSEDYYAGKVFNAVLGDGFTSLLFRELREKRGYAYATTSFYPTTVNMPRLFTYIGTAPEKAQNALEDMLKVTESFPFTEGDVEIAKRKIVGEWLMDHQTRARQAWYLGWFETIGLGYETDKLYTEKIKQVPYERVKEIREKYVDHIHHCVMVKP